MCFLRSFHLYLVFNFPSKNISQFEEARDAEDAIRGRDGYDFDGHRLRVSYLFISCNYFSCRLGVSCELRLVHLMISHLSYRWNLHMVGVDIHPQIVIVAIVVVVVVGVGEYPGALNIVVCGTYNAFYTMLHVIKGISKLVSSSCL